jgi:hypothetical protein
MYTSEKLRSISTTLPSLTLSDLLLLKDEIESIIRTKNQREVEIDPTTYRETSKVIYRSGSQSLAGVVWDDEPSSQVTTANPDEEIKTTEPVQKPSRPLGIWKGKVEISEDFYETSSDIISEFGIE